MLISSSAGLFLRNKTNPLAAIQQLPQVLEEEKKKQEDLKRRAEEEKRKQAELQQKLLAQLHAGPGIPVM